MTFSELKDLVAFYVDDLQFGYFTEAQVERFLNNAQIEVQKYLVLAGENYYLKCVETDTVIGQSDYVLPQDFFKLHRLEMVLDSNDESVLPIKPITLNQKDFFNQGNGQSLAYYLKRGRLILNPPPDQIQTLRLFYSYQVAELVNDSQIPDIPDQYQEALAVWAAYDCLIKDDRDPSTLMVKKNEYLALMKTAADQRKVDRPREIVTTGFDDFGIYF